MRWLARGAIAMALCACGGNERPESSTSAPSEPSRSPVSSPTASLDLQAMVLPVPEYEGRGRNLFTFGPRERTVPEPLPPPEPSPAPRPPTPRPTIPPRPSLPASRLDVQYAGFVEKTGASGEKLKYAVFLEGKEIFAAAEGETVASGFTVVEIGLETVTVSPQGSSTTQRLPLKTN